MIIHVITNVHNEAQIMPYFLRHYASFADRIFVYDAGSDDGTREIVSSCPKAELIDWECDGVNDAVYMQLNNSAYIHHSRGVADWVIMADADEFIYHPAILEVLRHYQKTGTNLTVPQGYNMVSDVFPTTKGQIYEEVVRGCIHDPESKPCVFNPNLTMNFGAGKHDARPEPTNQVKRGPFGELKLLHYAFLGLEFRQARIAARGRRMSQVNIDNKWGLYNFSTPEQIEQEFRIIQELAYQVIAR
ncbi:glycosyltransferase family 2 protein [bacterium]|nr:glycosyltransferase family 2 protein [bacterium]